MSVRLLFQMINAALAPNWNAVNYSIVTRQSTSTDNVKNTFSTFQYVSNDWTSDFLQHCTGDHLWFCASISILISSRNSINNLYQRWLNFNFLRLHYALPYYNLCVIAFSLRSNSCWYCSKWRYTVLSWST